MNKLLALQRSPMSIANEHVLFADNKRISEYSSTRTSLPIRTFLFRQAGPPTFLVWNYFWQENGISFITNKQKPYHAKHIKPFVFDPTFTDPLLSKLPRILL